MDLTSRTLRFAVVIFLPLAHLSGVIFYGTGDPAHNTTAPTGPLEGSGWHLQGQWGAFCGTPIAPSHFLTAKHFAPQGNHFVLGETSYTVVDTMDDPESDLRICKIRETFPAFAPLYTKSDETGKLLVLFGRGSKRGREVVRGTLRGWEWGSGDAVLRWGTNVATDLFDGGTAYGANLIGADFDSDAGPDEATLSPGDSGGGVFLRDGDVWKLAGVNSWVDGPYNTIASENGAFFAALFLEDGFFLDSLQSGGRVSEPGSGPGSLYFTRISSRLNWIKSVIGTKEMASTRPVRYTEAHADPPSFETRTDSLQSGECLLRCRAQPRTDR
ncbi:MAG: hypothetical protein IAE94_13040 [Chthoniobacterales bacterium]|nr:hypothetical protein [Chthoniobacterales bacterium]